MKNTPSYTGRFLDSIADIILNSLILIAIWYNTDSNFIYIILAFLGIQLQGTLYNYYYVILRNKLSGDTTSRVFEYETPIAMKGEKQKNVNLLFRIYKLLYGAFDKTIYTLDSNANEGKIFPNLLMTGVSTFGLGFQLLIISILLVIGFKDYIVSFFIWYSLMIMVFICIRKLL